MLGMSLSETRTAVLRHTRETLWQAATEMKACHFWSFFFLPRGCRLLCFSFSFRAAAVVKVMHWASRMSSSLPMATGMPSCFSSACSSASSRGWYVSTFLYRAGLEQMWRLTASSVSAARRATCDALTPSSSSLSSPAGSKAAANPQEELERRDDDLGALSLQPSRPGAPLRE